MEKIRKYRPIDDTFMQIMFQDDIEFTESVLKIILGIDNLKITKQDTQFNMKSLTGTRVLTLDVFATDIEGKLYNIEVQRSDDGTTAKRARFHSSILDVNFLQAGEDFEKLPTNYVIFITENDVIGRNKLAYNFQFVVGQNTQIFRY